MPPKKATKTSVSSTEAKTRAQLQTEQKALWDQHTSSSSAQLDREVKVASEGDALDFIRFLDQRVPLMVNDGDWQQFLQVHRLKDDVKVQNPGAHRWTLVKNKAVGGPEQERLLQLLPQDSHNRWKKLTGTSLGVSDQGAGPLMDTIAFAWTWADVHEQFKLRQWLSLEAKTNKPESRAHKKRRWDFVQGPGKTLFGATDAERSQAASRRLRFLLVQEAQRIAETRAQAELFIIQNQEHAMKRDLRQIRLQLLRSSAILAGLAYEMRQIARFLQAIVPQTQPAHVAILPSQDPVAVHMTTLARAAAKDTVYMYALGKLLLPPGMSS